MISLQMVYAHSLKCSSGSKFNIFYKYKATFELEFLKRKFESQERET